MKRVEVLRYGVAPTAPIPPPLPRPWTVKPTIIVRISSTLIRAWRPLNVVTFGADNKSTPPRFSIVLIATRNCGSVKIPVKVPKVGIPCARFPNPPVTFWSVGNRGDPAVGVSPDCGVAPAGLAVVGRPEEDGADYPDIDLVLDRGATEYRHRDGRPYADTQAARSR